MKTIHSRESLVLAGLVGLLLAAGFQARAQPGSILPEESRYDVAAYVWPSCHHDTRFGPMLWPEGAGEWEIIKQGNPRFEGHYQPKVPLWGYEPDNDPVVMEKWIEAATAHDVNVFIFDWYWYDGGPFLESSLNDGFLKARNNRKMTFYVMWTNHDVKRNYWNVHQFKEDTSLLWHGAVDQENYRTVVARVIRQYFTQPNYYTIDGKPVFSIFSIQNFVKGLGGVEQARQGLDYFRQATLQAGFPGLHVQMIAGGKPNAQLLETIAQLGPDSITTYNWGGPHPEEYIRWGTEAEERRRLWDEALTIPYFANASIGWDDSPRFPAKTARDIVHYNNTPESFATFLQKAKEYADRHPEQPKLVTVFSWNEWVEGGYLLPDMHTGFTYLEAVKRVISGRYDRFK